MPKCFEKKYLILGNLVFLAQSVNFLLCCCLLLLLVVVVVLLLLVVVVVVVVLVVCDMCLMAAVPAVP